MAILIGSGVNETVNALNSWGQGQRANKALNVNTAQKQLLELSRLGISNEDPRKQKALSAIMSGGNPFAMLMSDKSKVPSLQSAQQQTGKGGGQQGQYAPSAQSQKKLSGLQSEEKGLMLQEAIRDERKKISEIDSAMKGLGDLAGAGTPEGDIDADIAKDLIREKSMAENRLGAGLEELKKSDYWEKSSSKKNIADGNYFLPDAKGKWKPIPKDATKGIGETIAKPREEMDVVTKQIDKEKTQFLKDDAKRLNKSVKTGGPMTGTETQMRAKVRRDFKILSDQAGGNTDSLRKVYDDYVTDMKSIDYNFRRKPYYPSFEKQFASLFRGRSGGRRSGGSGVGTGNFKMYGQDPTTGRIREMFVNTQDLNTARQTFAKQFGFDPGKNVSIKTKDKSMDAGVRSQWNMDYNLKVANNLGVKKAVATLRARNKDYTTSGIDQTAFENLAKTMGVGIGDNADAFDTDAMRKLLSDLSDDKVVGLLRYIQEDIAAGNSSKTVANNIKKAKTYEGYARRFQSKNSTGDKPRTTVKDIAGQGNGRTKFNNKVDAL